MTHVNKTPLDLTLHLVSVGGNSDGGWVPGDGYPNPQVGRVGQRYVDVQTGHIYGPKTRDGWPQDPAYTLNLGNIAGQFANILSRVPALEVRTANTESRVTTLEGRADFTSDLIIQQQNRTNDHELRIETLEADSGEIKRRIGMVDTSLSARMLAAEDDLSGLRHLRDTDLADFNSRVNTLQTSLNGNSSQITHLQESYTGFTQTWAQDVLTLRSEFNGNLATIDETLRTHADRFSATAQSISTLQVQVGDARGLITTESQTRADQYSALSTQISTLSAEFGGSIANISTQQTAMANEFEAYAGVVQHVTAELGDVRANMTDQVEAMTTATDAVARRVSTLEGATSDLSGRITTEEAARVSADSAVLTSAQSMIAAAESGLQTQITQESAARLSGDQAEAYQRSLVQSQLTQEMNAAVSQEANTRASADGYLGSRYTLAVSTSASGVQSVAGMEIASTSAGGRQATNHIAFFADRFYITHGSANTTEVPFEVVGGRVYIKSAIIQNASITDAKIANAAITSAKIANAAIETAHIGQAVVKTLHIGAEQVIVPGGNQGQYSTSVTMHSDYPTNWLVIVTFMQGDGKHRHRWTMTADGQPYDSTTPNGGTNGAMGRMIHLAAGTHTFGISCNETTGEAICSIAVFGAKR